MGALTLVEGFVGTGKNLFCVRSVLLNPLWEIYSTFELLGQLAKRYHILKVSDLLEIPENSFILDDEGWNFFESRESQRASNKMGSYVKNQLRKTNVQIFIAQPDSLEIDVRFRRLSAWDHYVYCRRVPNGSPFWKFWDFEFLITSKYKNGVLGRRREYLRYEDAKKYFHLWRTLDKTIPLNQSRLEADLLVNDTELYWERVAEIIDLIKPAITKRATLRVVETTFRDHKISSKYLYDVYNVLNGKVKIQSYLKIRKSKGRV